MSWMLIVQLAVAWLVTAGAVTLLLSCLFRGAALGDERSRAPRS